MSTIETQKQSCGQAFTKFVLSRMEDDNAFGAAMRRADNPGTEYQAWEYLIKWCDLEKEWERRPFAIIASAIASAKPISDGYLGIGKSIASCYEDRNKSDPAKAKLRRLLACDSVKEVCVILRPLLSLISSNSVRLNYGQLLDELIYFGERTRQKWAVDFYGRREDDSIGS